MNALTCGGCNGTGKTQSNSKRINCRTCAGSGCVPQRFPLPAGVAAARDRRRFRFGCGHDGNRADTAGPALCLDCEIVAVKALLAQAKTTPLRFPRA